MKRTVLKYISCALISALLLILSSCGSDTSAEDILYEICADIRLPAGQTYLSQANAGDANFLSGDTADALYGKSAFDEILPLTKDYAIYLSSFEKPYEIAVFRCYSRSDTDTVAKMCLRRADEISVLLKDTSFASLCDNARVMIFKKYVVMILCDDPDLALDVARRVLK